MPSKDMKIRRSKSDISEMINKTRYTVERHRPSAVIVELRIEEEVRFRRDSDNAVNRWIFRNESRVENGSSSELLSQMPRVERCRRSRAKKTSNL
jgi:hypothetical protein